MPNSDSSLDFGYLDGISNPGVTGFTTSPFPGQSVIAPGIILTGEDGDTVTRPSWAKDGSFLAFRKLQQLVPEYKKFLLDNAVQDEARNLSVQEGADLLGARIIGRWPSGAPVDLAPLADDPALGADPSRNNDFDFAHTDLGLDLTSDQSRCPFSAHIRKTRPRADLGDANTANQAIRAGIPYGPEVSADESAANATSTDRGLAFGECSWSEREQDVNVFLSHSDVPIEHWAGIPLPAGDLGEQRWVR